MIKLPHFSILAVIISVNYSAQSVSDELEQSVDMLRECVRIREGQPTLPGDFCDAVNDIICFCALTRPSVWCLMVNGFFLSFFSLLFSLLFCVCTFCTIQ